MSDEILIETNRCLISEYQHDELDLYYALLGNPVVMQHFPHKELLDDLERCRDNFEKQLLYYRIQEGFGVWKATLKNGEHIGHAVLNQPVLSNTGERGGPTQLGYSLRPEYWNQGFATEFAQAMLKRGFNDYKLTEIIAMTSKSNYASARVMQKIGMRFAGITDEYFGEQLVCYNIQKCEWQATKNGS